MRDIDMEKREILKIVSVKRMKKMEKVKVRVPASTTNLGPGFDCLGLALKLYNVVEMEKIEGSEVIIEISGEGEKELPRDEKNIIFPAAKMVFDRVGEDFSGLRIREVNSIPICKGLGSSGAALLAGTIAANALLEAGLTESEILNLAAQLDGHPDNVAASLFGGLVVVSPDKGELKWLKLDIPEGLKVVLTIPEMEVLTENARSILPKNVSFSDAVFSLSRAAMLTSSLIKGKWDYLSLATEDKLHQPNYISRTENPLSRGWKRSSKALKRQGRRGFFSPEQGQELLPLPTKGRRK